MPIDFLIEALLAKLIEKAYDDVHEIVTPSITDAVARIQADLSQISDNVERQLLTPLHAGLTFASLQEWGKACDQFVFAQAADPDSPVANAALGLTLIKQGQLERGRDYLRASILTNPFLSPNCVVEALNLLPSAETSFFKWSLEFPPEHIRECGRRRSLIRRVRSLLQETPHGTVHTIAGGCYDVAIVWSEYARDIRKTTRQLLTLLDFKNGAVLWSRQIDGSICLAAPQIICVEDSSREYVHVIEPSDGSVTRRMSTRFFRAAYQPHGITTPFYQRSGISPQAAYEATMVTEPVVKSAQDQVAPVRPFHRRTSPLRELLSVRLLVGGSLEVENEWHHWHSGQGISGGNLVPRCDLISDSSIRCFSSENAA